MPQQFTMPLLLVLLAAFVYLMMIRPQQKRAKAQRETLSTLGPGTRVLLANGFYATVVSVLDTAVEVELAPGTTSLVVKQAVVQIVPPESDPGVDQAEAAGEPDSAEWTSDETATDGHVAVEAGPDTVSEPATPVSDPEPEGSRAERSPRSDA